MSFTDVSRAWTRGPGPLRTRWGRALASAAMVLLLLPLALVAQTEGQALASQNLRPYWHVFVAYALAWILLFGWLVSVARRIARVERSLGE